ncbi:MAG: AraC family transcriptional regulator [Rikenellaceae bacterium]|nr:AraC family transcriptional regulator [Rikenellaceae bacterium]
MSKEQNLLSWQPTITKYTQPQRNGIQSQTLHRHAIGYVLRGKKYLYYGDERREVNRGDIFYLGVGNHYIEDIPEDNRPFEQIVFYYDSSRLNKILNSLSITYQLSINNDHSCPNCEKRQDVIFPSWNTLKNFFITINQYIKDDQFSKDNTAEYLKITELIYLILSNNDCCIKSKILNNIDTLTASFEQTIQDNIFNDISIEELAQKCNRSLTSFKKEFKKHFFEPPHKWFIKQRLMHSRLLLISTNKSVSEIGIECNFPNTSHFIKLFKKEFGMTPVAYRHRNRQNKLGPVPQTQIGNLS